MNPILTEIYSTIIPSAPFIIAAFALLWAVLLIWLYLQFNKQRRIARRIDMLEEQLAEGVQAPKNSNPLA